MAGKSHRKGLSLVKLMEMFPNDETARQWIEKIVWPNGPSCPKCGSFNVQSNIKHKTMTHRCRDCEDKPRFSVFSRPKQWEGRITHLKLIVLTDPSLLDELQFRSASNRRAEQHPGSRSVGPSLTAAPLLRT